MPDVNKRLLLAAETLHREISGTDADAFAEAILRRVGIAPVPGLQYRHTRGGLAAPAPGGRSGDTGHTPPKARRRAELADLLCRIDAPKGDENDVVAPAEIRRIAELTELLEGEQAARPWWHRAAQAGDPLASAVANEL